MFVPTLDIDLIWHTHQCSPGAYYLATMEKAGKFLNHDDSIEDAKLGDGYMRTRELWRVRFAEEYAVCGCWDCEALMDVVEDVVEDVDGKDLEERVRKGIEKVKVYREKEAVVRRREEILEELKKRGQGVIPS